jgi:hypothetical protein
MKSQNNAISQTQNVSLSINFQCLQSQLVGVHSAYLNQQIGASCELIPAIGAAELIRMVRDEVEALGLQRWVVVRVRPDQCVHH